MGFKRSTKIAIPFPCISTIITLPSGTDRRKAPVALSPSQRTNTCFAAASSLKMNGFRSPWRALSIGRGSSRVKQRRDSLTKSTVYLVRRSLTQKLLREPQRFSSIRRARLSLSANSSSTPLEFPTHWASDTISSLGTTEIFPLHYAQRVAVRYSWLRFDIQY